LIRLSRFPVRWCKLRPAAGSFLGLLAELLS
jgi:hypothetical protein